MEINKLLHKESKDLIINKHNYYFTFWYRRKFTNTEPLIYEEKIMNFIK